jgi:DnaJ-class molecular chaperone
MGAQGTPPDMDMFFQQMFGGFPFAQMFGSAGGAGIEIIHGPGGATYIRQRQSPTIVQVSITLEQAFTGVALPVSKPGTSEVEIVDIPAGIQNGQTLAVSPNFHVCVNVLQHALFSRNGNDLFIKKTLSLKEALCGTQVSFMHLNGKHMTLNITNAVVSPGMRKSFPGMGFTTHGNLVVEFEVTFPAVLTQEQRDALQTLL